MYLNMSVYAQVQRIEYFNYKKIILLSTVFDTLSN